MFGNRRREFNRKFLKINVRKIEEWTGLSRPAANGLVKALVEKGILEQRNRRTKYGRDFEYKKYLKLFTDETK